MASGVGTARTGGIRGSRRARARFYAAVVVACGFAIPLAAVGWFADVKLEQREVARIDGRLGATLDTADAGMRSVVAAVDAEGRRLARRPDLQRALVDRDRVALRGLVGQVPGASVWIGSTRLAGPRIAPAAIAHRTAIARRGEVIGSVAVQVPLDDTVLERVSAAKPSNTALLVVRHGRVVAGPDKGSRLAPPAGRASEVALGSGSFRALSAPVAHGATLVAATPASAVDAAVSRTRLSVALASIGVLLLIVVLSDLLVPNLAPSLQRQGSDEDRRRLDLLGDALAARHDRRALYPIVLATMVEASGAPGGVLIDGAEEVAREGDIGTPGEPVVIRLGEDDGRDVLLILAAPLGGFDEERKRSAQELAPQAAAALEHARQHELARRDAATDPLTGLANRRRFLGVLEEELRRSGRYGRPVAVVVADLDDFKKVNDLYGHGAGDAVLRAAAEAFRTGCRDVDLPARLGGEELAVLAPESDAAAAAELAERLRASLENLQVQTPRGELSVTASFGVAAAKPGDSAELLLQAADAALYDAKRAGKNRIAVWTASDLEISC